MFLFGFLNSKGFFLPKKHQNKEVIYQTSILGTSRAKRWPRRHRTARTGRTFSFSFSYLYTNYHMSYIFSVMKIKCRITHYLLSIFISIYWSATNNISSQALSYSMVICLSLFFCPMNRDLEDHVDHKDWGDQKEKW